MDAMRKAAKAAAQPYMRIGTIVGGDSLVGWSVSVPSHVDHYGSTVPMDGIRSLSNGSHSVGDEVIVARTNYNKPRDGALWVILDTKGSTDGTPTKYTSSKIWYPRHRFNQERHSAALTKPKSLSPYFPANSTWKAWKVSASRTDFMRADDRYVFQVTIDVDGYNAIMAWPLRSPKDEQGQPKAYDPAIKLQLDRSVDQQITHIWIDKIKGLVWIVRGYGSRLEIYDSALVHLVATGTGLNVSFQCEPVRTSDTTLISLGYSLDLEMKWLRWTLPALTSSSFITQWPQWSTAPRLPNSVQKISYPIWSWDDWDSIDRELDMHASLVTDNSSKLIVVPGNDSGSVSIMQLNRSLQYDLDTSSPDANVAHLYSRGQLQVIDDTGSTKWQKNYWGDDVTELGGTKTTLQAAIGKKNSYGAVTPIISVNGEIFSHFVRHDFACQRLHFVTFDSSFRDRLAQIRIDDPQSFENTEWWNRAPAPPWAWSPAYIQTKIADYMAAFSPGNTSQFRDIQTAHVEGLIKHAAADGKMRARLDFASNQNRKHVDYDTGDPNSTPYGPRNPRRFHVASSDNDFSGGISRRSGTASSSGQTLKQILNLSDDEKCIIWFAIEQYEGTRWPGWDIRYNYYFGTAPAFDSRYTRFPVFDSNGGFAFNSSPPYWENQYNGFETIQYPYGDLSSGGQYRVGGNFSTGYRESGQYSTFYTGHFAYCLGADGVGNTQFNEPKVGWTDYVDPEGNFNHRTTSVTYQAWVVKFDKIPVTATDPNRGHNVYNPIHDGRAMLYFLPRRVEQRDPPLTVPPQNEPWIPTAAILLPTVLMCRTDFTANAKIDIDLTPPLHSTPAGFAYVADDEQPAASILWMWVDGFVFKIVNGVIKKKMAVEGTETWSAATIFFADDAIWLSGTGTGSAMYKIEKVTPPT